MVRHGETEWSRTGRHTGATDVPLTDRGRAQAEGLAATLSTWQFVDVRVSPLLRARATAELAGLGPLTTDTDLVEWDYGDYEGRTSADIQRHDPGWTIFAGHTPRGESLIEVEARADAVLARIADQLAVGDVALVAHGHVLRVLASRWLEESGRFGAHLGLDAASVSILDRAHDVPILQSWNRTLSVD